MKRCNKCGAEKPLDQYYKDRQSSDGKRNQCKECVKEQVRQYANRPDIKEKNRQQSKERYLANRVELLARTKAYFDALGPENRKMRNAEYFKTVNGRARLIWLKARRRHKGSVNDFVSFERILRGVEGGVCEQTGVPFRLEPHPIYRRHMFGPSVDKIDPKGDYTEENVTVVCNMYNFGKNQYTRDEFLQFCRMFVAYADKEPKA